MANSTMSSFKSMALVLLLTLSSPASACYYLPKRPIESHHPPPYMRGGHHHHRRHHHHHHHHHHHNNHHHQHSLPVHQPPSQRSPPSPSVPAVSPTCPIDALKLGLCLDVLGGLAHVDGVGDAVQNTCCPVLAGLVEVEAAVCLCTAMRLKLLSLNVYIPLALIVLITCGKNPPPGYVCPGP